MSYVLYFLLDREKSIVPKDFLDFALKDPFFSFSLTESNDVKLTYKDNNIIFETNIYLRTKSIIPNLHLLNPKYKNINISLELSPLLPRFKVNLFLEKFNSIAKNFDLYMYSEFLNDVEAFKKDDVLYTYDMYKKAYVVKYPEETKDLHFVDRMYLDDYLTYEKEYERVRKLYLENEIEVPKIIYYLDEGVNQIKTAIAWDGEAKVLIPPFVDYIVYGKDNDKKIYMAKEFNAYLGKFMTNITGFMPGTKVIVAKKIAKCKKVISKAKFTMILKKFKVVNQTSLID